MRTSAVLSLLALTSALPIGAQVPAAPQKLSYTGTGPSETTPFTIGTRWEVKFDAMAGNVTVETVDGTLVAGGTSMGAGAIFVGAGGTYKLHIDASRGQLPWHVQIFNVGQPGGTGPSAEAGTYTPPDMTSLTADGAGQSPAPTTSTTRAGGTIAAAPASGITTAPGATTPTVTPPSSLLVPAPPAAGPSKMTDDQARAVVLVKGDNGEGTGFLVRLPTGPVVITNQHVIEANPHLQITTSSGQTVKFSGLQGASDRDLAMIPIVDDHYSYLEMATDIGSAVQVGDQVITPGNSLGGETMLNTSGTVVALGPQKVEISNPVYHGNSGGPIFHLKSGKVIGVVTEGMKVDADNTLDKASFGNARSAITSQMRYFGLRLDNVPHWDTYTWLRFENETEFLHEFRERSKCLDSYLNTGLQDQSEWGLYYLKDDKIKAANEALADMVNGSDTSQRLDAERNLIFSLGAVADADLDQVQQPSNFYSFDQQRARDETDYRKALKKEIDGMSNDVTRITGLARRNN